MITIIVSLLVIAVLILVAHHNAKTRTMRKLIDNMPGPKPLPVIGSALEFGTNTVDFFRNINRVVNEYGPITKVWIGPYLLVLLSEPKYIEVILGSNKFLDKAFFYDYLKPWLGTGLLTGTGQKWKTHRKLITPTFHFKILEQFLDVFNSNGQILIESLGKHANAPAFDIYPYINLCVLDIICETAMGVNINAQRESDSTYVKAVKGMAEVVMQRSFKPWIQPEMLFRLSSTGRLQEKSLAVLHGTTNSVIKKRKQEFFQKKETNNSPERSDTNDIGVKKRMAFLDMLLQTSQDGAYLSDEEIREEVDTFMFEGHDTTTSGICFSLWVLAKYQDAQAKVVKELEDIFGDSERPTSYNDLQNMKYMEQVIKESLRLYPSVPVYGRHILEDIHVDGYTIPAGAHVNIMTYNVHYNPDYYPNPKKFDPDRFLPENCIGRHPYSYIPFSAGPRNCIGQKFAMLEIKSTVSKVLRNFELHLENPEEEHDTIVELVLKSANGFNLKVKPRVKTH